MFLLAGTRARRERARARIEVLARASDPAALADLLGRRRLLPLIGTRLLDVAPSVLPGSFAASVERSVESTRLHGQAVETLTRRITSRLARAGVPALPLKGPLLAAETHGDIGLRMTNDIDLLVPAERLDAAVQAVGAEGYDAPHDRCGPSGLPDLHFELSHPRLPTVELHWRLHWYEMAFSRDLLARSRAGEDGLLRPDPGDELATLLLFYARDGFYGLRHAADVAAWWDRHGTAGDNGRADAHVAAYPALARPLRSAAVAAEDATGVPRSALVSSAPRATGRELRAARLAAWSGEGDEDQLRANISLVRCLLGSRASHRALVRHDLLPPAAAVDPPRTRDANGARALRIRVIHAAKILARYTLGLWAVRGGRVWDPPPTDQSKLPA
jgi:hypothetical protein